VKKKSTCEDVWNQIAINVNFVQKLPKTLLQNAKGIFNNQPPSFMFSIVRKLKHRMLLSLFVNDPWEQRIPFITKVQNLLNFFSPN
jgi:hypothetical protein